MYFRPLLGSIAVLAALSAPAAGQDWVFTPEPFDEAFHGFAAAVSVDDNITHGFENNYILGAAYQRFRGTPDGLRVGLEVGLAGRFGAVNSAELWAGIVGRMDFELFNVIRVSPSLSWGLSAVTAPMAGCETDRQGPDGDARLLFYLGPEIAFSLIDHPQTEIFIRDHHRSGAWGRLGNMQGGQDALAVGVRHQF
jgi:hypothetical protein